ncbi:hypothetical protein EYB53_012305 [Candidatus Chloroploca sp. M-50]|uniref:Uncharacterized protein n=1 Tax=Candidatus Chloroploca mongolica TaxID=2528176 RepID=A0ABS4DAM6_9CHLR|nr:hypothetical protein [Candidatus Chloroploca mongolica]MBP1466488.1 hypothetical protein [Candidatus Chloroploca mongolica]
MSTHCSCPVCTRLYSPNEAICPECGWELQGAYELVPDTAEIQLRYERDLAHARLAYRERQLQHAQSQLAANAQRDQARIQALEVRLAALETRVNERRDLGWRTRITTAPISQMNAVNLVQLARLSKEQDLFNQFAWFPDGTRLSVASATGVLLYDVITLQEIWCVTSFQVSVHGTLTNSAIC